MTELTADGARRLRGLGRKMTADVRVGKGGLTEGVVRQVDDLLARRELVKVKLLDAAGLDAAQMAEQLGEAAGAAVAAVVGKTALLYRPNEQLPPEQRIELD